MKIRTGLGIDVHSFDDSRKFYLGGIIIPYHKGLTGHSDADVLLHAIIDAILGAANLKDIGFFFPDNDNKYKNIRSTVLLEKTAILIKEKKFKIGNIDCTVCLEKPKIAKYIPEMQKRIANILKIDIEDISIKATTFEKMGFVGEEKGVLALANCIIYKDGV